MKTILLTFVFICSALLGFGQSIIIDTTFNIGSGFNAFSSTVALQPDGKILFGGGFTEYNGTPTNYIVRLNPDGSIDPSFDTGTGFNDVVQALIVQEDGKILVGGSFTSYNEVAGVGRFVRLNEDGSLDDSFSNEQKFDNTVTNIVLQNDGKILACGTFTSYNYITHKKIARL